MFPQSMICEVRLVAVSSPPPVDLCGHIENALTSEGVEQVRRLDREVWFEVHLEKWPLVVRERHWLFRFFESGTISIWENGPELIARANLSCVAALKAMLMLMAVLVFSVFVLAKNMPALGIAEAILCCAGIFVAEFTWNRHRLERWLQRTLLAAPSVLDADTSHCALV